jgi:glycosyltransferase involved in cell wall biosynthesis
MTSQLVAGLLNRGHDVDLISLSIDERDHGVFEGDRLRVVVGPLRERRRWVDGFRVERDFVSRSVTDSKPDVVQAMWTYEFALGSIASGLPTVVSIQDWGPTIFRLRPDHYRIVRAAMQVRALRKKARFVANSPYLAVRAQRITRSEVDVIPNGTDFPEVAPDPDRSGTSPAVVLSVANGFGRRKNVKRLLEAFPMIRAKHAGVVLRLIGDDFQSGGPAEAWAASRGLSHGVEFVGPQPASAVRDALASAAVLAHASLEESFGVVLVEAAAVGTPVVAGESSGAVPWVLNGGSSGRLVDVTSPSSIAAAVSELLGDPRSAADLALRAFDECSHRFSIEGMIDSYEGVYVKTLEEQTGRS